MAIVLVTEESIPPVYRFSLTEKLAIEIADKGYPVHLICVKGSGDFFHRGVKYHPVQVSEWNLFELKKRVEANIRLISKVFELCRTEEIRLVYGWWPILFFAKLMRKKIVSDMPEFIDVMYRSFNKPIAPLMGPLLRVFQESVARLSEIVITESDIARGVWCTRGLLYEKSLAMPYGVDVDLFVRSKTDKDFRNRYKIGKYEPIIMYHGDIGIDDGVDVLIDAIRGMSVKTVIIGDGDPKYMQYLKKIAPDNVTFTGWIPYIHIPGILRNADIYVAPFRSSLYTNSTCPIKVMEAMAAGRPVVVSELHALNRYLNDGFDCMIFRPGNSESLKNIILDLLADQRFRERLGNNAVDTAKSLFDYHLRITEEAPRLIELAGRTKR